AGRFDRSRPTAADGARALVGACGGRRGAQPEQAVELRHAQHLADGVARPHDHQRATHRTETGDRPQDGSEDRPAPRPFGAPAAIATAPVDQASASARNRN
ncbi:MAG: hypothetical protein ACK559_28015, partial [bacterium]